jgi:membrane protein DedA with SNARE-associated domain
MMAEATGIPLPSEIILPFSGYLVFKGELSFILVCLTGAVGDLAGSYIAYQIGLKGGRPLLEKYGKWVLISKHDIDLAEKWFKKYGKITVFFSRFLPVVRTYSSFPAGISEMNLSIFTLYTFIGALIWSVILTWVGFKLGQNWHTFGNYFRQFDLLIGIVIVILIGLYIYRHLKNLKSN